MRRLLTLFLCLLPVVASAQTGTVISGDQVMVGGRRLTDALALKADAAPLAAALLSKADRSSTSATLANTVTLPTFTSALAGKVDTGTYTAGLSTKADQAAVTSALAAKADATAMATALGLKANSTDVAAAISNATSPLAPIASPTFTGIPKAPTPAAGDSSAKVATTSFVGSAVSAGTAGLAPAASPAFTGTPTVPTAPAGANTTQAASTAYADRAVSTLQPQVTFVYPTAATVATLTVTPPAFTLGGFTSSADGGGGGIYVQATDAARPCDLVTAAGVRYHNMSPVVVPEMCGAVAATNPFAADPTNAANNVTAINNAILLGQYTGAPVRLLGKPYHLAGTVNLNFAATVFAGPGSLSDNYSTTSRGVALLIEDTDGVSVVKTAERANVGGFAIRYLNQQASTATGCGVEFNRLVSFNIHDIAVYRAATSFCIPQNVYAGTNDIGGSVGAIASNLVYDGVFTNLASYTASQAHYDLRNYQGGGTNVVMQGIYANGGSALNWASRGQSVAYVFRLAQWSGLTVGGVSVDGQDFTNNLIEAVGVHAIINDFRIEEGQCITDNCFWVTLGGANSSLVWRYRELYNVRATAAYAPTKQVFFRINNSTSSPTDYYLSVGSTRIGGSNTVLYGTQTVTTAGVSGAVAATLTFVDLSYATPANPLVSAINIDAVMEDGGAATAGWNLTTGTNRYWYYDGTDDAMTPVRTFHGRLVSTAEGSRAGAYLSYVRYIDYNESVSGTGANNLASPTSAAMFPYPPSMEVRLTGLVPTGAPFCYRGGGGSPGSWQSCGRGSGYYSLGDASVSFDPNSSAATFIGMTAITADRTLTFTNSRGFVGDQKCVYREPSATGAFNYNLIDGNTGATLASIPANASKPLSACIFYDIGNQRWRLLSSVLSMGLDLPKRPAAANDNEAERLAA